MLNNEADLDCTARPGHLAALCQSLVLVLFACQAGWADSSVAPVPVGYALEGTIEVTFFNYSGPWRTYKEKFRVSVDPPRWIIHLDSDTKAFPNGPAYWESGYDGSSLFCFETFDPKSQLPKDGPVVHSGAIKPGQMPPPAHLDDTCAIWFAYASQGFLADQTNQLLRPIWEMEYPGLWETGIQLPARWTLNPQAHGLPALAVFFNDGKGRTWQDKHVVFDAPKPFDSGFTNAIYDTVFTNLGTISLPISARLSVYCANLQTRRSTNDLLLMRDFRMTANKFALSPSIKSFRPELLQPAMVTDDRLRDRHPEFRPRTLITNGQWELGLKPDLAQRYRLFQANLRKPSRERYAQVVFAVGAILIPAFFAWRAKRRRSS
jgi:hypothetical protein